MEKNSLIGTLILIITGNLYAGNITIDFEETSQGLRASYAGSLDLTGFSIEPLDRFISYVDPNPEFSSEIVLQEPFVFAFSSSPSNQDLRLYRADFGSYAVHFFQENAFFSTENAIQATGSPLGFSIAGTDIPFNQIVVAADYLSGSPLSGSVVFPDLSLENVEELCGIYAIDNQATNTFTILTNSVPFSPEITNFNFDSVTGTAKLSFRGKATQVYGIKRSDTLDFTQANTVTLERADVGTLGFNKLGFRTNEEGNAIISLSLSGNSAAFVRVEVILSDLFPFL